MRLQPCWPSVSWERRDVLSPQQGLCAAAWHCPSFPGEEGHVEGRKECRSQAWPPSLRVLSLWESSGSSSYSAASCVVQLT